VRLLSRNAYLRHLGVNELRKRVQARRRDRRDHQLRHRWRLRQLQCLLIQGDSSLSHRVQHGSWFGMHGSDSCHHHMVWMQAREQQARRAEGRDASSAR